MLLRIIIILALVALIVLGIRRIYMDWSRKFKNDETEERRLRRERDLREREQPGVIDLTRDKDGTFRPGDRDKRN
jgi:FtsZ-interacting cell division protein ZipA